MDTSHLYSRYRDETEALQVDGDTVSDSDVCCPQTSSFFTENKYAKPRWNPGRRVQHIAREIRR